MLNLAGLWDSEPWHGNGVGFLLEIPSIRSTPLSSEMPFDPFGGLFDATFDCYLAKEKQHLAAFGG
jgi:hypothetical protein